MKKPIDTHLCDSEPVRFINAIQSFGAMVVIDEQSHIKCHSKNFFDFTGQSPFSLLDQVLKPHMIPEDKFVTTESFLNNLKIIQIEKKDEAFHFPMNSHLEKLSTATDLKSLLENCAQVIGELTDFDRVMVYKFHDDHHGEVVAETVKPGVDHYLGLHYPASDIPAPARAIFLENWVRMIPDVHYSLVGLESSLPEVLDLGQVLLRGVSPIHIEYLKNMNVGATLTISLVVNKKLWGLIACHHLTPKYVSKSNRERCESIGRFTSSLINGVYLNEKQFHTGRIKDIYQNLVERLEKTSDMAKELAFHSPTLLDLVDAHGASAALYVDGYWVNIGHTPNETQLNRLVDWMNKEHAGESLYSTHELSTHFAEAIEYKDIASGLLAISVPKTERNYVFWFRPEAVQTVTWAGNPDKVVSEVNGKLSPRASFQEWTKEVYGKSHPWNSWEKEAALELRSLILAVDLKKQFAKEQIARSDAEKAKQTREDLMAVVSHDLKNPLSSIQMNIQLLKRFLATNDIKITNLIERTLRSATTMNNLINDILSIAKLESGQFELSKALLPLESVIQESVEMLLPMAADKGIGLTIHTGSFECEAHYDYDRILQVLSNLIGNAIKFTPDNGKIEVKIEQCGPSFVKISVTDSGPGIPMENQKNVFDRFWQANQTRRLGTGLGLSIAKGIVEAHGGEIWVESKPGEGAQFQFSLPL